MVVQVFVFYFIFIIHITSAVDEFVCPKDGRWPNPTDCEKYYTCNSGINIEGWCGTGMTYDPNHQRCDLSKNIECKNGERPTWTPPEGWLQSESATNYVVTKTTTVSSHDDNEEEEFEVKKKTRTSSNPKMTTTSTRASTKLARNRVTASMPELMENSDCIFQGNMPDPDNCQSYYSCRDDVVKRMRCPEKQLFDGDTRLCNDYRKVFCADRPVNERDIDPCLTQQNGWYADNENQCRSYYLCTDQRKSKMGECPMGSKWHSQKLRCDDPKTIPAPCGLRTNTAISLVPQYYSIVAISFSIFFF
ncbi:unnamed protein product [Rotaria magnacalcarata]|uniref:Chitin-binding type-2 domain-containing protein n=4 Tax=Rotaria magnacalcarata TaxID=392030 RepID=A0A817AFR1_9BILA|nr:unnamed protein product [Rotaria magnacalcarata]CAF2055205.1 unnamed protein product [Rotaria magnacalcarata]CAF2253779.1 unnamed protein product [Rotaria magnacalcarata]CAF4098152.1 unnamed protein product [Rotaria magnacalcarata]